MSFASDIKLQRNVLLIGFLLMIIKVFAYISTNSNAILSDALESLVNISSGAFALISLKIASQPSDKNHPYGHGKVEFISGFIEGTLIVIAGGIMIVKASYNLFVPQVLEGLGLGLLLTAITGLVNFVMGYRLKAEGEKKKSMIMVSEGSHLMSDGYTSLALILGIAVVWATGITLLDNIISIAFGAFVLYTGYKIFRKSISGIMDEIDMDLVESIVDDLNKERQEDWIDVHNLRVIKFGRDIHIDCHLTLPWYYSLSKAHEQVDKFELLLKKHIGGNAEFFIHADPCEEHSCSICSLKDCPERKHAFVKKVHWQTDNVLANRKHQE